MRFFEVDSAVDAIMSAAMLAQTKAGSRSQQGQLSMNGFLQMLKNAGIMMDYEGFKTVYDTNPQLANVIEKFDKDTVTFMSADGDNKAIDNTKQSNQPSPDERITQMARSAVRTREFKEAIGESGILYKGGVNKYGKEGMTKIQSAAGSGASAEEIGRIKDKYNKKKKITADVNEQDDYEKVNARQMTKRLQDIRYMVADMDDKISRVAERDNGDLTDQITTMSKLTTQLHLVLSRAISIVPTYESISKDLDEDTATDVARELKKRGVRHDASEDDIIKLIPSALKSMDLQNVMNMMNTSKDYRQDLLSDILDAVAENLDEMESIEEAIPTSEYDYDLMKFYKKVKELEDENAHGEVAEMLVNLYGTSPESMVIRGINGMHSAQGSIMPEQQKLRDMISNKYYNKLEQEVKKLKSTSPAYTDEGFASDGQRKAAFASGYKPKGKKKTENMRMNRFGKLEYDTDYSDIPNELEDDFDMKKLEKEFEKAIKNKNESMQSKFKNFLAGKK